MLLSEKTEARFNITTTESQKSYVEKQAEKRGISQSEFIRELIGNHKIQCENEELRNAAKLLATEYRTNKELTSLTEIDGDPFL